MGSRFKGQSDCYRRRITRRACVFVAVFIYFCLGGGGWEGLYVFHCERLNPLLLFFYSFIFGPFTFSATRPSNQWNNDEIGIVVFGTIQVQTMNTRWALDSLDHKTNTKSPELSFMMNLAAVNKLTPEQTRGGKSFPFSNSSTYCHESNASFLPDPLVKRIDATLVCGVRSLLSFSSMRSSGPGRLLKSDNVHLDRAKTASPT